MAFILKSDGTQVKGVTGEGPNGEFTLKQLQDAVGGYIEAVPGSGGRAYCNEEGLLRGLPLNEGASFAFGKRLVGDVIVLQEGDKQ